jgi:hypothetical protein
MYSNRRTTGANPTTESYNGSIVKNYSATSSLVRFKNKNSFFYFEKQSRLATATLLISQVVGLSQGFRTYLQFFIASLYG